MDQNKKEMLAQKIIEAVNENNDFCKEFLAAEDAVSLQKVLNDNGFDMTVEDIESMYADGLKEILAVKEGAETELSEDQLDDVAGGGFLKGTARLAVSSAAAFAFGCFVGVCPAAAPATPYVAGGLTAWTTAGYLDKKKKK
jgi:hypothetical protein